MSVADIERIARAYTRHRFEETRVGHAEEILAEQVDAFWKTYAKDVIAILHLIREPTEAMFEAAREADYPTDGDNLMTRATDKIVYQAMIDEILR